MMAKLLSTMSNICTYIHFISSEVPTYFITSTSVSSADLHVCPYANYYKPFIQKYVNSEKYLQLLDSFFHTNVSWLEQISLRNQFALRVEIFIISYFYKHVLVYTLTFCSNSGWMNICVSEYTYNRVHFVSMIGRPQAGGSTQYPYRARTKWLPYGDLRLQQFFAIALPLCIFGTIVGSVGNLD